MQSGQCQCLRFSLLHAVAFLVFCIATLTSAGIPMARFEAFMKQQSQTELGLYNVSDKVRILTATNFKEEVLQQNHSALVEFYNSYCGHCKRFAPTYKDLATQLYPWRDVLIVGAIDCASDENNDICREYEVMSYPSLRYFGPSYQPSEKHYGRPIETQNLMVIRSTLVQWLIAENRTANMTSWPNLQQLTESESNALFEGLDSQRKYVILIYEENNSTLGAEMSLNFLRWPAVQVRRVADQDLAAKFKIDGVQTKFAIIDRTGKVEPYGLESESESDFVSKVADILKTHQITERPGERTTTASAIVEAVNAAELAQNSEIVKEVKRNKHFVYQADLELAVRGVIFNEIAKASDISGERLLAVQRFLAVLQRYNPMGANGRKLISKLYEFVMQFNQELQGKQFEEESLRLKAELDPIFTAKHFVGCASSRAGLRGFTCALWQLCHFMTVQAARSDSSQDPLEVLQAMHGYIKHFFGCTHCAKHFQAMAARRKIWDVPNKDEAVLWLWGAHNEVNTRLAGDETEDPEFPKIQFPTQSSCPRCYRNPPGAPESLDTNWDKDEVLSFLKNIHNPEYINRYGLEREDLLPPTIEKLRQKRMLGNVFSDMDMRMGMLLYGFCIVMMVVAFKLFAFKGYRRKPYGHDLLGKA